PFGGMGYRAHRTMLQRLGITGKNETWEHFARKTLPSLDYVRRMGGTYGASTFIALMALIAGDDGLCPADRIGVLSFGSGSCAELWGGMVLPEARKTTATAGLPALLDARLTISVAQYEAVEKARTAVVDLGDFAPDMQSLDGWYEHHYRGRRL